MCFWHMSCYIYESTACRLIGGWARQETRAVCIGLKIQEEAEYAV